mmetsp:Transcript_26075/g.43059  ORF Transcript_26075/g.43059 Transcript_26075/m.43059 type:complete len:330 (+) Transcript_26075:261-1250(+)
MTRADDTAVVLRRIAEETDCNGPLPLIALLPTHPEFDSEEVAASAAGLPVLRFNFLDEPELVWPEEAQRPQIPCRALHRGFMLSHERYTSLFLSLRQQGVHLVTPPDACERAHYYPLALTYALAPISPRACWAAVQQPADVRTAHFERLAYCTSQWGCEAVMMKDFVKSAKGQAQRFMRITEMEDLAELACELVQVRGSAFNRGIVVKELKPLMHYRAHGEPVTNEFRLFYGRGELLEPPCPNSYQGTSTEKPPAAMVQATTRAARALRSPYVSIDLAESADGSWFCLESGDGGFSGPATTQDLEAHWAALKACFEGVPFGTDIYSTLL